MSVESKIICVEPENKNFSKIDIKPIWQCQSQLKLIYGDVLFTSLKPNQRIILEHQSHPVLEGFVTAYKNHRPITISPDIFLLLIIQAFSNHISSEPEKFRHMFVNFTGKQELSVQRTDLNINHMTSKDWEGIFPDFINQISESTGKEIIDILTPDFTTTTTISHTVGQLTIMSTLKDYFTYSSLVGGCGFPYITIEGTLEDWLKIVRKLENLEKYDFRWFTYKAIYLISKIAQTLCENQDTQFWKDMMRIKYGGYYDPEVIDSWFTWFFPFDSDNCRVVNDLKNIDSLQPEIQTIPLNLQIVGKGTFNCEVYAGFVGLTQNKKTASIKPEIGWFIKVEGLNRQIRFSGCENEIDDDTEESLTEDDIAKYYPSEENDIIDKSQTSKCCLLV